MKKEIIIFIQDQLNKKGYKAGKPDGIIGRKTIAAINKGKGLPKEWSVKRKMVGFIQKLAKARDIEAGPIDGLWGPQTENAYEELRERIETGKKPRVWRPESIVIKKAGKWPCQTPEKELRALPLR